MTIGGERGIRTLDTLLTYTRFPGVLLQPLGHLTTLLETRFPSILTPALRADYKKFFL